MIVFVRIDERLLHGQVAVKWVNYTKATDIVLVDDYVASHPMQRNLFLAMSPQGKQVFVLTVEDANRLLKGDKFLSPESRILVVTKTPANVLRLHQAGIPFDALNIGNMSAKGARKQIYRFFFADADEQAQLKELSAHGIHVYYQEIPLGDEPKNLKNLLK